MPDKMLSDSDARDIVRLVSEVVVVPGGHAEKKRFLMEALARLIGADAWAWALSCQREPDKPQIYVSFLTGGLSDAQFVKLAQAVEHPEMIQFTEKFFREVQEKQTHLTRLRFQITNRALFEASAAREAWKQANIGPVILSLRPLDATSSSTIGIYRHYGRPEFSPREARIAHIILSEVAWLHEQGWPEDRGVGVPELGHRKRLALNLLIAGHSRKQIAEHMGISAHTVQGYIKDVYRHFGVNSQAELMKRFLIGNERDVS